MAKIEYTAECLCGGEIKTVFKKPTRFEPTIKRATCAGCGSEFLFTYSVEYANGARAYVPEHEVTNMTQKLRDAVSEKHGRPKPGDVVISAEKVGECMSPGPKLDQLVAWRLMGKPSPYEPGISQTEYEMRRNAWHVPYSTEIAAAWEVVMRFNYLYLFCHTDIPGWECKLMPDDEERFYARGAESAPHAICLAALKAKGITVS